MSTLLSHSAHHHGAPAGESRDPYAARDPTESVLVRTVRKHLPRFLELAAADGHWSLPGFVEDALRSIVTCGDFIQGFTHFRCERCEEVRIVPFSCKGRLCASCGGRRMSEFAAYAVDRVLPKCAYRQWTISFPWALRRTLAFNAKKARAIFKIAGEVIMAWIADVAAKVGVFGQPAGVLHIQRFGDGLNTNPHAHFVFSDAVFSAVEPLHSAESGGAKAVLSFRTRAPTHADMQLVADRIEHRVVRLLARQRGGEGEADDDSARLGRLADVKPVADRTASGARPMSPASPGRAKKPLAARSAGGFDVHAGVAIEAHARDGLERLLRYIARPPVAEARLRELSSGDIAVDLKRAWANNVRTLTFKPMALLARLAALVPPPGMRLTTYLGVISPHAELRPLVLPKPPPDDGHDPVAPQRPKKMTWADLLRRVFWIDPLLCPCGGRFRLVAVVKDPTSIQAICAALHLSGQLAEGRLPRGPPAHWPPPRVKKRRGSRRAPHKESPKNLREHQAPRAPRKSRATRGAKP